MLHEKIKAERNKKKISQAALARLIGVAQQTIGSWETGRTSPDPEMIKKLANFFDVSVDYLLDSDKTSSKNISEEKKPKDLQKILEDHEIMFDGIPLDDEEKQEILDIIQYKLYKRAKELNKRKK